MIEEYHDDMLEKLKNAVIDGYKSYAKEKAAKKK
jgi:hypothetical protein